MELEIENNEENTNQIITTQESTLTQDNEENSLLENTNEISYEVTTQSQNNFLDTKIGQTVNAALNIGLRAILPNMVEDQIIDIKDTIITEGFKEGLNKTVESVIDLGKSAMGLLTGKFENVSQIQTAIESGGMLDTISDGIDFGIKVARQAGILPQNVASIIKSGKNIIMNNIESNIENTLTTQLKGIEKVNEYIENWNQYYKEQNFSKMQLEYDKIGTKLKELVPIEETLQKARQVQTLHKLIKSKGIDFNLSDEEIELAKKLNS